MSFLCLLTGEDAPFRFCSSYHHHYYHCCRLMWCFRLSLRLCLHQALHLLPPPLQVLDLLALALELPSAPSSVPDSQALAAPIQQPVISGPLGAVSAGGYTTTNANTFSIVSPVFMTTDTTVLPTVLSSGVLPPVWLADLQNKCVAPPVCCRTWFSTPQ